MVSVTHADPNLARLQPRFRRKVELALHECALDGLHVKVVEATRSYARSDWLFAQGRTRPGSIVTKARGGYSFHNFGLAVDIYPVVNGEIDWNFNPKSPEWRKVVAIFKKHGMRWGGDAFGKFHDYPHMEDFPHAALWVLRLRYPFGWRG